MLGWLKLSPADDEKCRSEACPYQRVNNVEMKESFGNVSAHQRPGHSKQEI